MKRTLIYLLLILLLIPAGLIAEPTKGFQYQSTMWDKDGEVVTNQAVTVRFSILKQISTKPETTELLYSESHDTVTDAKGSVYLQIGTGNVISGNFAAIDWWGDIFIKTEIGKRGEALSYVSTQQLLNVPYALSAEKTLMLKSDDNTNWNLICDNDGNLKAIPVPKRFSKLVFYDEFDGTGLPDESKWGYEEGFVRNGELQYYTVAREDNCFQKDGYLHIMCLNDNAFIENAFTHKKWNHPWVYDRKDTIVSITSASVCTKHKFAFKHGRVEVRAKLPLCSGTWPAIWLMPEGYEYQWPNSGEIDIMEHVGNDPRNVYFTLHCKEWNSETVSNKYANKTAINDVTDWHIYALEWHEGRIYWYVDGELKATALKGIDYDDDKWPFNSYDFYLILNSAFGGGWGGGENNKEVDINGLPQSYIIDYVRIYQ